MDLGLEVTERDVAVIVRVHGEVDVSTAPRLRQELVELASQGRSLVIVDLDRVDFLDSTGLGVLVGGLKRFRALGGDLVLVCTRERILRVLAMTRLDRAFDLHASVGAALSAAALSG